MKIMIEIKGGEVTRVAVPPVYSSKDGRPVKAFICDHDLAEDGDDCSILAVADFDQALKLLHFKEVSIKQNTEEEAAELEGENGQA